MMKTNRITRLLGAAVLLMGLSASSASAEDTESDDPMGLGEITLAETDLEICIATAIQANAPHVAPIMRMIEDNGQIRRSFIAASEDNGFEQVTTVMISHDLTSPGPSGFSGLSMFVNEAETRSASAEIDFKKAVFVQYEETPGSEPVIDLDNGEEAPAERLERVIATFESLRTAIPLCLGIPRAVIGGPSPI